MKELIEELNNEGWVVQIMPGCVVKMWKQKCGKEIYAIRKENDIEIALQKVSLNREKN